MQQILINARIITPHRMIANGCIVVDGSRIAAVHDSSDGIDLSQYAVIDAQGAYAAAGFIDMHVHGGGGFEFNCATPEEVRAICIAHARHGTTSILPTTLAAPITDLYATIEAVKQAQALTTECNILGIHLEGPYFAQAQRGAQSAEHILLPDPAIYMPLLDQWEQIRMMGAAPELAGGMELGQVLRERGIVASIAHSDATADEVVQAVENGYSDVTHIYSGCSLVHRRHGYRVAGVVEAGLLLDELTVQVIADGKHLPATLLRLIYKNKGADRISLITDALFAAASDFGEGDVLTQKNGVPAVLEDGVMKLLDREAFAGSIATTNQLVRTMMRLADVPLLDAVKMATLTPAKVLGIDDHKGRLAAGYDADIVLFNQNIDIQLTMVMGRTIFSQDIQTTEGIRVKDA